MRNVGGGSTHSEARKTLSSLEQEHNRIRQAAVGVLSLRRALKLGKLLVCLASICSSCDLRPHRTERGPVRRPHRCSWISFPDILACRCTKLGVP